MLRRERKEREREKESLSLAVYLGPRLEDSFDLLPGMLSPTDAIYTLAVARLRLWLMYRHPAQGCFRQTDAMPSEQP